MALVNCPECSAEVSDTSLKCSKCGYQIRKPKRGFFGKLIKWGFILFNIIMIIWLITGVGGAAKSIDVETMSEAEQAGAAIGTGIGAFLVVVIWVIGDILLGIFVFFTRPKS